MRAISVFGTGISALVAVSAVATPTAGAAATTKAWTAPVAVGAAPKGDGAVARVAISANGKGTIGWSSGGAMPTVFARDFTPSGALGAGAVVGNGVIVSAVGRDDAGNVAVTGRTTGAAWAAARAAKGTTFALRTLSTGTFVDVPAAFGLKNGFLLASTNSFSPTAKSAGVPTGQGIGFTPDGGSVPIGKVLEQVETSDPEHGFDGSDWALSAEDHAITAGRRETSAPKNGKPPKTVPALIRLGKPATRNSLLGLDRFGAAAVSTAGSNVAVAGLEVQQANDIAQRGVPAVFTGEETAMNEGVEIPGVPDRRALEVDVAALVGGGAVVTWLQQTTSTATSRQGTPKWAIVDEDGEVETRGTFVNADDASNLRIVRAGSVEIAIWVRGVGTKARFNAAQISGDTVRLIKAPAGTPALRSGSVTPLQIRASGKQVALGFVDSATDTVRVAVQTLK